MNSSFQLLLYIMKVKVQEDQKVFSLNFSDVMWNPQLKSPPKYRRVDWNKNALKNYAHT